MENEDLYVELRCRCCNKTTRKQVVGQYSSSFSIEEVVSKLYVDVCKKCKKATVWEVIAYLGLNK